MWCSDAIFGNARSLVATSWSEGPNDEHVERHTASWTLRPRAQIRDRHVQELEIRRIE